MVFILYLLGLYMHVVGCLLWTLFRYNKVWVPPNDFGSVNLDYMVNAHIDNTFFYNYINMVYHATFAFNLVDIGPRSALELTVITFLFIASAFYNAQIYGEFYTQRQN